MALFVNSSVSIYFKATENCFCPTFEFNLSVRNHCVISSVKNKILDEIRQSNRLKENLVKRLCSVLEWIAVVLSVSS